MPLWLADYPEWLQFCWDFIKPPRNDEIALQHFFLACSSARIFFLLHLCCMQFFSSNKRLQEFFFKITPPPPPQELNGRPLSMDHWLMRSGSRDMVFSPGRKHCVVFLPKKLNSLSLCGIASCHRNRDKLPPDGPLSSYADLILPYY